MNKPLGLVTTEGDALVNARDVVIELRPTLGTVKIVEMLERAGIKRFVLVGAKPMITPKQVDKLKKYLESVPSRPRRKEAGDQVIETIAPAKQGELKFGDGEIEKRLDRIEVEIISVNQSIARVEALIMTLKEQFTNQQ